MARRGRPMRVAGHYFLVDTRRNVVLDPDVNLERLARKLGALAAYERYAKD